jgi:hypothetical protein
MVTIPVTERVQVNGSRVGDLFVPQIKNDQKVNIQSVAEAEQGVRAGDL